MIVSVFESEKKMDRRLLHESDLALVKTDERSWDDEMMYRVAKSRFSSDGTLIKASELHGFVQQQEEKIRDVKRNEGVEIDVEV